MKYTPEQVQQAIEEFLKQGNEGYQICESTSTPFNGGKWHHGYFSSGGWAYECLRWHLEQLTKGKNNV